MNKPSLSTLFVLLLLVAAVISCHQKRSGKARVLVYSNDSAFASGKVAAFASLQKLGQENDFLVDTTSSADLFVEDSLQNYSAIVFLNTQGDALNNYQEADFQRYINAGGGFVGVHSAANTEIDWGWYGQLVGGKFSEISSEVKEGRVSASDKKHPASKGVPTDWVVSDRWYTFKNFNEKVQVLLSVGEEVFNQSVEAAPISWFHDYDGGRSFYTSIGGQEQNYTDTAFLQHLLGGIKYAIGDNRKLDYAKATTLRVPASEGFQKVSMAEGEFFEPTEMAILPNLDILVAQRRGELILFNKQTNTVSQVGLLDVYHETQVPNVNAEEGFMGLTIDPDFATNNYVYTFYSPKDTSVNRLSRFVFKDNKLDMSSEKIILQFYSQRDICCHTGGSLAFGKNRELFLSTGDNSTPFDEPGEKYVSKGYSPRDLRAGHEQYDASRSAGNTNDLRGKILRIQVNQDGSYTIPEGNLFTKQADTKPEIFVMGNRNPYRISVDKKTGYLYWGEVGPDANEDGEKRGPRGYDEVNQARKAGFFGWPFFVGNNYSYYAYDYATGVSGGTYDPAKPVNSSPNNTGLKELPAAMPAFIWYPYAVSPEFPQVGSGGRNAMAGPVYHTDLFPSDTRYPDYYDGKLIIYDWVRGWVKAVSMYPNGDFNKMEPFLGQIKFNSPIDMEVGPDGQLYVLEYGSGWFSKNEDSGLSRIDYSAQATKNNDGKTDAAKDAGGTTMGHQQGTVPKGESLIAASDCKACHAVEKKSVGPSYKAVAERYKDNKDAPEQLVKKIMGGGSGNWGEVAMAAHPGLEESDVKEMVSWILSH